MVLNTCYEINQANMASIASATDSILLDCTIRPKIYSGLKLNKFHNFIPQK